MKRVSFNNSIIFGPYLTWFINKKELYHQLGLFIAPTIQLLLIIMIMLVAHPMTAC